jgi:hypothetical protein
MDKMQTFGWAVKQMQNGARVRRAGWNGKGMYLFIVLNWTFTDGANDNSPTQPFICLKTVSGSDVPWLASQTDMLATDWEIAA